MGYSEESFIDDIRETLEYAYGEFLCCEIEVTLHCSEYPNNDLGPLIADIERLMDRSKT